MKSKEQLYYKSKRGFAISIVVLFVSIILFMYLDSSFYDPIYLELQEFDSIRIERVHQEFDFIKDSVLPDIVRFSKYYATQDFLQILVNNEDVREDAKHNYSFVQESILELMNSGTFQGELRANMTNRTIPKLLVPYQEFMQESLYTNFTYELLSGRMYEKTPLFLSTQFEIIVEFSSQDLSLDFTEYLNVETSISLSEFKDPQVLLYANSSTDESLREARTIEEYKGTWSWEVFNETYNQGLVTVFINPEYQYSIGTSFLRSIVNSSQRAWYTDIVSFLSFEYEQDSTPYDTKNHNLSHLLYGPSLFVASFDNISSQVDLTAYKRVFETSLSGDDCSIVGVNGNGCYLKNSREVDVSNMQSNFTISFWLNYNEQGTIIKSTAFDIVANPSSEEIEFSAIFDDNGLLSTATSSEILVDTNEWNHILIHSLEDNTIELLVNGVLVNGGDMRGILGSFDKVFFSNAKFDEIVIINRSLSKEEISELISSRKVTFLEYEESLFNYGLELSGSSSEYVELDLDDSYGSFDEFAIEFWITIESGEGNIVDFSGLSSELKIGTFGEELHINLSSSVDTLDEKILGFNFEDGKNKHIIVQKRFGNIEVFINNFLVGEYEYQGGFEDYDSFKLAHKSSLKGVLDEFVIFNVSLSNYEVASHYYNFKSEVSGCCNYLKLYNEDTNALPLRDEHSISTIFLTNVSIPNITHYRMNQKSPVYEGDEIVQTFPLTAQWYNKKYDACQLEAYDMQSFANLSKIELEDVGNSCEELIDIGVY